MKKILIIDDRKDHFSKLKTLLEKKYLIIPESHSKMSAAIEYPHIDRVDIKEFVLRQIDENYKDLGLVICDIHLGENNPQGGYDIVKAIRNHRILSTPKWTSLVPIIAVTNYADKQDGIISVGADFSLEKDYICDNVELFQAVIETQILKFEQSLNYIYPPELKDIILDFKQKHADKTTVFLMTSFAEEHKNTIKQIVEVLKEHDITPCLADKQGGENHDDLWPNIEVFIHGCDFGIGIYADDSILKGGEADEEGREKEHFKRIRINPNMSQEVGYMLGLQKKVCVLKNKKLDKLPTDLAGKIYVEYDGEDDLKEKLGEWLKNKILK